MMAAMKLFKPGIFLLPFVAVILLLGTLFVVVAPSQARRDTSLREEVIQTHTEPAVERTCWARVNDDSTDYDSVQAAIDEAQPGDRVKVSGYCDDLHTRPIPPGYLNAPDSGVITQVVYITKPIILQGGYTSDFSQPPDYQANPTILDAGSQGRVVMIAGHITSTLEGLYITGGDADGLSGSGWLHKGVGGGIFVISSTVSINNNLIYSNTAAMGGGLFLADSAASIIQNIIRDNVAEVYDVIYSDGGGLYLLESDALVRENLMRPTRQGIMAGA